MVRELVNGLPSLPKLRSLNLDRIGKNAEIIQGHRDRVKDREQVALASRRGFYHGPGIAKGPGYDYLKANNLISRLLLDCRYPDTFRKTTASGLTAPADMEQFLYWGDVDSVFAKGWDDPSAVVHMEADTEGPTYMEDGGAAHGNNCTVEFASSPTMVMVHVEEGGDARVGGNQFPIVRPDQWGFTLFFTISNIPLTGDVVLVESPGEWRLLVPDGTGTVRLEFTGGGSTTQTIATLGGGGGMVNATVTYNPTTLAALLAVEAVTSLPPAPSVIIGASFATAPPTGIVDARVDNPYMLLELGGDPAEVELRIPYFRFVETTPLSTGSIQQITIQDGSRDTWFVGG